MKPSRYNLRTQSHLAPLIVLLLLALTFTASAQSTQRPKEANLQTKSLSYLNKTAEKVDLNGLTALLLQADRLNWDNFGLGGLKPFVHDGRTASIAFWSKGALKTIELDDPAMTATHQDFVTRLQIFLGVGQAA